MESLKILIPTDFSVQAEYAYHMVKKLAPMARLDIHFLHVLDVPDTVSMTVAGEIETCGEIDVNYVLHQKEIAGRKLAELKFLYGNEIQAHLVFGKITDIILDYSEQNHFDLIVMGRKASRGIKAILSGSETQVIARRSMVPVLSIMCDRTDLEINNILFVHDFSNPAPGHVDLISKLVNAFDTRIHFLQVVAGKLPEEKAMVEANMKKFAELNDISNYECHLVNDKDVENGIAHFSQLKNMDIVCIGTHGKGGMFHHSATEKLINHLFKPIISFHLNDH
jgi:nucleotide-binding universal stress UspA family protein